MLLNFFFCSTEMAAWLVANGPISIGINANMMQVRRKNVKTLQSTSLCNTPVPICSKGDW